MSALPPNGGETWQGIVFGLMIGIREMERRMEKLESMANPSEEKMLVVSTGEREALTEEEKKARREGYSLVAIIAIPPPNSERVEA